jgi:hypothetical protein
MTKGPDQLDNHQAFPQSCCIDRELEAHHTRQLSVPDWSSWQWHRQNPFKNNVKSVETHKGKRACMQELDAMHHAANISAPVKH